MGEIIMIDVERFKGLKIDSMRVRQLIEEIEEQEVDIVGIIAGGKKKRFAKQCSCWNRRVNR